MSRKRHGSVEPYLRRDLRRKENQFMLPLPPEGLTAWGKRKWRDEELRQMWMPNGVSQATSSTPAAPAAPVPKASTRVRAGAAYWPKRPKGQFLTRLGIWFRFGWLCERTSHFAVGCRFVWPTRSRQLIFLSQLQMWLCER